MKSKNPPKKNPTTHPPPPPSSHSIIILPVFRFHRVTLNSWNRLENITARLTRFGRLYVSKLLKNSAVQKIKKTPTPPPLGHALNKLLLKNKINPYLIQNEKKSLLSHTWYQLLYFCSALNSLPSSPNLYAVGVAFAPPPKTWQPKQNNYVVKW